MPITDSDLTVHCPIGQGVRMTPHGCENYRARNPESCARQSCGRLPRETADRMPTRKSNALVCGRCNRQRLIVAKGMCKSCYNAENSKQARLNGKIKPRPAGAMTITFQIHVSDPGQVAELADVISRLAAMHGVK